VLCHPFNLKHLPLQYDFESVAYGMLGGQLSQGLRENSGNLGMGWACCQRCVNFAFAHKAHAHNFQRLLLVVQKQSSSINTLGLLPKNSQYCRIPLPTQRTWQYLKRLRNDFLAAKKTCQMCNDEFILGMIDMTARKMTGRAPPVVTSVGDQ
jgi:hypothetical protein